jgi:hypothetical protein
MSYAETIIKNFSFLDHTMNLLYCYGVIWETDKSKSLVDTADSKKSTVGGIGEGLVGFQNGAIYTIQFKDVVAVVSDVSEEEFSQQAVDTNVKNMGWLTQHAPLHEDIVTTIMHKTTTLPMKFCTIFKNKEQVIRMLEEKYTDIIYFLHHMQGKVEMGLKVYANVSKLREMIKEEAVDVKKLEQEAVRKTPGQAYFVRQKIDVLLKDKVRQHILLEKQKIMNKIQKFLVEAKKNDVLARKMTGKEAGLEMVLNLALLVQKDSLTDLNQLVQILRMELIMYQLEFSGPFAAYNFIR